MNKKGFTLVELLAVIAILALLVIIALPNVLKMFNEAKKDIFLTETKNIYKEVSKKYISEAMKGNNLSYISSKNDKKLDINAKDGLDYCINLSNEGKITSMVVIDDNYYIEYDGKNDLNDYTKDNVEVIEKELKMICSSSTSKLISSPEIKKCTYDGKLENNITYNDGIYTYTYHPWINGLWEVTLTNKESTTSINKPFCNVIDGKNVVNASGLFKGSKASSIDLSSFNTSYINNMSYMFQNTSATSITGLEYLDTSNTTNMSYMFNNSNAVSLELSGFNTNKVTNMSSMFNNSQATTIDVSSFNTSNVTNMASMFLGANTKNIDLNNFDTSNVTNMCGMFRDSKIEALNLNNFDTSNVTNMSAMFEGTNDIITIDITNFDTNKVTNMSTMFSGCKAINIIGLDKLNTSNVKNMYSMFNRTAIKELDLSNFDTSNVTSMERMFNGSEVETLDLSNFDTSNVTNMHWMFYGTKAKELNLTSFNTSKVTNMTGTFRGTKLEELDLSSFNIDNADISYIFDGATIKKVLVKKQTDLEKYKNSGSVLITTKFYIKE